MKKETGSLNKEVEAVLQAVITLGDNLGDQIKEIRQVMVTKDDLKIAIEDVKEKLLAEIRPIGRAVDKDAHTLMNHEKRITHIEKYPVLK